MPGAPKVTTCVPGPWWDVYVVDFVEQGLQLNTVSVSCMGGRDNPREVGLDEEQLER